MELLDKFPLILTHDEVHSRLCSGKGDLGGRFTDREFFKRGEALLRPRAAFTYSCVTDHQRETVALSGVRFNSKVLARNLSRTDRAFPFVITIGGELENDASTARDIVHQVYLETMGNMALGQYLRYLERHIAVRYELGLVSRFSPGQLDWPIEEQRSLFSLLGDVEGKIGVRLDERFMMVPRKSASGVIFPTTTPFNACRLCPKECEWREAPYDEPLRRSYGI